MNTSVTNMTLRFVTGNMQRERPVTRCTTDTEAFDEWRIEYTDRSGVSGVSCNSQEIAQYNYLRNLETALGQKIEEPVFIPKT